MKYLILFILFVLSCSTQPPCEHGCATAPAGERNVDLFSQLSHVDVKTERVEYSESLSGFLARPSTEGNYPGVVMIHEWWGLNDNIKDMARLLANEGYVVLAVDLYGTVAEDSAKARELSSAARENPEAAVKNMKDAVAYLKKLGAYKIGSMGWCFGGGMSLQLALAEEMDATVVYYGNVISDKEQLSHITWPVLGIFGAEDTGIPVESVRAFETVLTELKIENNIQVYPGVGHAFANPSGARYAPAETVDAWEKTVAVLNKHLGENK